MDWYVVVKTINGHPYRYRQKTWREGGRVRTKSVYVGPAERSFIEASAVQIDDLVAGAREFSDLRDFPEDAEDIKTIDRYKALLRKGEPIPAIEVTRLDNGTLLVNDGHHRVQAARELGIEELPARIRHVSPPGTQKGKRRPGA